MSEAEAHKPSANTRADAPKALLKADQDGGRLSLDAQTTLAGVRPSAWDYKPGNRRALEWILDQYKEKTPKDPTIREKFNVQETFGPYRLYFYSLDCAEPRHVHVQRECRVCKCWLDPVALVDNHGFNAVELRLISKLVREHRVRIVEGWNEHCGDD